MHKKLSAVCLIGLFLLPFIFGLNTANADVWVNGYYRSNGTYVQGHYRSSPDGNPYNNWSYPGNTNPYTGKVAPGNPDTYLKNYYNDSSAGSSGGSYYNYFPTSVPTPSCPLMSSYNSISGTCQCYSGYVADGGSCVSGLSYCWNKYGYNSSYDSLNKSCECDSGYELKYGTCTRIQKTNDIDYPLYYPTPTPSQACPINSSQTNGVCTCNNGYTANSSKTACVAITPTESCQSSYGANTYEKDGLCYCKDGYQWNTGKTACYLILTTLTPSFTPNSTPTLTPLSTVQQNISAQIFNTSISCKEGHSPSLDKKRCIKIPDNAHIANDGKNVWLCNKGYKEEGNSCILADENSDSTISDTKVSEQAEKWTKILKFWKWF